MLHIDGLVQQRESLPGESYDRVSPGGIIQLDDYGFWQGAEKATEEFLHKRIASRVDQARLLRAATLDPTMISD